MLDLDHPMTKFVFAISREDGAILSIAKRMTLVATPEKRELLNHAHKHIDQMHQIVLKGWGQSDKMSAAIELLQKQVEILASIPSQNDFTINWRGQKCTVCGSLIKNLEQYADMLYCGQCLDTIEPGRMAIDEAFGLSWI